MPEDHITADGHRQPSPDTQVLLRLLAQLGEQQATYHRERLEEARRTRYEIEALHRTIVAALGGRPATMDPQTPAAPGGQPSPYVSKEAFMALIDVLADHLLPDLEKLLKAKMS